MSLKDKIKQLIINQYGAVKYDDYVTKGSPFQGMYVFDGGKRAFSEESLDIQASKYLQAFSDELEAIKKEIDQRCTNDLQVAEIYKDAKGTVYKISETVIDEYIKDKLK